MEKATNGSAMTVVQPTSASTALEPSTVEQAFWLATQLVKSGLLGKGIQRPEAAFAVILAGRELGLTAMQSLRSIHVIEGRPTLSADLMVALVKRSPTCRYFKLVESTPEIATYVTDRIGEGETRMSFTMKEAQVAGVAGRDNWKKWPAAMLRARCIAALARVVYSDLLAGIYEADSEEISPSRSKMPSASANDAMDAGYEESPDPVVELDPAEAGKQAANVVEQWTQRFETATSSDELKAMGAQARAEVFDAGVLTAISVEYGIAAKKLKGAA